MEEAQEVYQSQTKEELIEELADILEVIDSLCDIYKFTLQDIIAIQNQKNKNVGASKNANLLL